SRRRRRRGSEGYEPSSAPTGKRGLRAVVGADGEARATSRRRRRRGSEGYEPSSAPTGKRGLRAVGGAAGEARATSRRRRRRGSEGYEPSEVAGVATHGTTGHVVVPARSTYVPAASDHCITVLQLGALLPKLVGA